jgi:hypothetical protein
MADPAQQSDPMQRDLATTYSLYVQLGARVYPAQGVGGRRPAPASRPPVNVQMVSAMAELADYIGKWNSYVRYLLNPVTKIELTAREGVRCPYCGADLVAWLRPGNEDRSEIVCTNLTPHYDPPGRWTPADWPRLGVLAGVHDDARFGPRLHSVHET